MKKLKFILEEENKQIEINESQISCSSDIFEAYNLLSIGYSIAINFSYPNSNCYDYCEVDEIWFEDENTKVFSVIKKRKENVS